MSVAYIHHTYYAPVRLLVYLVIIGVVAIIGAVSRKSRRRNMGQYGYRYGQPPQQGWQQTPPPGSPYGAWGNNQQGHGQQPPQQGVPQQPYPGQPPQGWGQVPPPQGYGQPPRQQGYQPPPW